jgi:hypothetical protein
MKSHQPNSEYKMPDEPTTTTIAFSTVRFTEKPEEIYVFLDSTAARSHQSDHHCPTHFIQLPKRSNGGEGG